ncbi:MAG TPA: hypothetical protein VKY15_08670, partial [Acidimicrobiales bacterium]|nr:hypothetical protein [Acidimicrobiales bacterium]
MTTQTSAPARQMHPLDPLSPEEIRSAADILRREGVLGDSAALAQVVLDEPDKEVVARHRPGDPVERRVRLQVVPGPEPDVVEAVVSLGQGRVVSLAERKGARPFLLFGEALMAIVVTKEHPGWQEAMRRRGVSDLDKVQIDPWPAGAFGLEFEEGRRLARCLAYVRHEPTDNGYAKPVEGLIAVVDLGRKEVVELLDYGPVPLPPENGSYLASQVGPLRTDLKPVEITQPEGPSFVVEGNLVR